MTEPSTHAKPWTANPWQLGTNENGNNSEKGKVEIFITNNSPSFPRPWSSQLFCWLPSLFAESRAQNRTALEGGSPMRLTRLLPITMLLVTGEWHLNYKRKYFIIRFSEYLLGEKVPLGICCAKKGHYHDRRFVCHRCFIYFFNVPDFLILRFNIFMDYWKIVLLFS